MKLFGGFRPVALCVVILFTTQFFVRDFSDPYQRPIAGDAQAYYAYLPAIFIYGDLDYNFIPQINSTYYPQHYEKSFLLDVDGEKVNKTFPGAAVLYAPFFFVAHGIALICGLPADGYSEVYQICFVIGQWFWLIAGLFFLHKVLLSFEFSRRTVLLAGVLLLFGTNLFFYSFYDVSVTHGMNFFLVNVFLFLLIRFKNGGRVSALAWAIFVLALIGITRPTNIMVVLLLPVFFPGREFYTACWIALRKPANFLGLTAAALVVFFIPMLLWKLQSDQWIVYGYGDEGFIFSDPHFREFLFSYLKGWFTWTPLALLIISVGLFVLFHLNKRQGFFVVIFYAVSIYVFSSWWCWYYGAGMSQRVMIDHYVLLAFLFCVAWQWIERFVKGRLIFLTLVLALSGLNLVQAWQIRYGILPMGSVTAEQYWDNFLRFKKQAKIYPRENWKHLKKTEIDLDSAGSQNISAHVRWVEGSWITDISPSDAYSGVVSTTFNDPVRKGSKMVISFDVRPAEADNPESRLVYHYDTLSTEAKTYHFGQFLEKNKWTRIEVLDEVVSGAFHSLSLFFWNGGTEERIEFRNIRVEHYFSEGYM